MKIYTEIVYTWDDNKGELVEESSKSFDYQGEVTLCDTKRYWHHHAASDALGIGNGGDNSWQQKQQQRQHKQHQQMHGQECRIWGKIFGIKGQKVLVKCGKVLA